MPRRPQWIKDLAEITGRVEGLPTNVISRETFEFVFNLQRTAAAYWLRRLGAETHGNTLLIDKRTLLLSLYNIAASPEYLQEVRRRDRLAEHLEKSRRDQAARRVRVPVGEPVEAIADLPAGVHLQPGELRIEFHGTEDLLRHLFELSTAVQSDFPAFQRACGD